MVGELSFSQMFVGWEANSVCKVFKAQNLRPAKSVLTD
jgi:hypothetical protein